MTNFAHFLQQTAMTQTGSIESYEHQGQKVWLKKAAKRHSTLIYVPLQWFSKLLGLQMLAPVPNTGGDRAIACEVARIQALAQLGVNVPEVLAFQSNAFLLKDAAPNGEPVVQLEQALSHKQDSESRLALFQKSVHSIREIHLKKSYLSEAFARNILVDAAENFVYIDFETDPAQVLSLQDCQTRDWLCFIFSTARRFEEHELSAATDILAESIGTDTEIYSDICRTGSKLYWILHLKPEKLGGDGRRLNKCIKLLKMLDQARALPMI